MYATSPRSSCAIREARPEEDQELQHLIHHEQSGDEKEIYLDFDKATTEEGGKVEAGLHLRRQ